jgi:hypothetical protein
LRWSAIRLFSEIEMIQTELIENYKFKGGVFSSLDYSKNYLGEIVYIMFWDDNLGEVRRKGDSFQSMFPPYFKAEPNQLEERLIDLSIKKLYDFNIYEDLLRVLQTNEGRKFMEDYEGYLREVGGERAVLALTNKIGNDSDHYKK